MFVRYTCDAFNVNNFSMFLSKTGSSLAFVQKCGAPTPFAGKVGGPSFICHYIGKLPWENGKNVSYLR